MSAKRADAPVWALTSGSAATDRQRTMSGPCAFESLPEWLTLREGRRPLVVVAPHGGRRRRDARFGDNVNDLHTAELAWELAERLGAHAIINHGLDRNDVDLNRISHLSERVPQVLALLRSAVEHAGRGGQAALVLFVHGWNMVLPCCDIGIGLRRRDAAAARAAAPGQADEIGDPRLFGRFPTVARGVYDTTVVAIERSLRSRGIGAAIGRRYPASGRDNAAQLFSGRHLEHAHEDVAALARLALAGEVDAVQLELGIVLRWQGQLRDAFVDGLLEALGETRADVDSKVSAAGLAAGCGAVVARVAGAGVGAGVAAPRASGDWILHRDDTAVDQQPHVEPGYSLQAVLDAAGEAALFAGVEATGGHSMAGRLCLVFADGSMMLLVGEGPWDGEAGNYSLEGFCWKAGPAGVIDIELDAPMIRYRRHDAYLDLEQGLADSDLVDGHVRLRVEPEGEGYGRLSGEINVGGFRIVVDTVAFLERGGRRGGAQAKSALPQRGRVRVMVASPGA